MINQELIEYISNKVSGGSTKESLTSELKTGGWTEVDINDAFKKCALSTSNPSVDSKKNPLFNFFESFFKIIGKLIVVFIVLVLLGGLILFGTCLFGNI